MGLLKSGACFTEELELNCPTIVGCVTSLPLGPAAVAGTTQVLGKDGQYHVLPATPVIPTPAAPALSVSGNQLTIAGGNTVTLPDSDAQALSIAGNVISLTNGGSVTLPTTAAPAAQTLSISGQNLTISGGNTVALPAGASTVFATPAQTVAGTATALIVNPADLYARENIAAQTGLSNDVTAIPAPTANQSNWGTNLLGERVHYMPGVGWKIVADRYGAQIVQPAGVIPTPLSAWATAVSLTMPRAGRIIATAHIVVDNSTFQTWAGGLALNGINKSANNAVDIGPVTQPSYAGGVTTHNTSSGNAVVTWTGDVAAGNILAAQGITVGSIGQMRLANLEYTYIN